MDQVLFTWEIYVCYFLSVPSCVFVAKVPFVKIQTVVSLCKSHVPVAFKYSATFFQTVTTLLHYFSGTTCFLSCCLTLIDKAKSDRSIKASPRQHKQWPHWKPNCVWDLTPWQLGPPKENKSGFCDHNIWALTVTTLSTKVRTRYILSPLRWIQHISPPCIGNQWAANYLWKIYALLNYCRWRPSGIYTAAWSHKSCIASTCKVTSDSLWGREYMDVWVCARLSAHIKMKLPSIT